MNYYYYYFVVSYFIFCKFENFFVSSSDHVAMLCFQISFFLLSSSSSSSPFPVFSVLLFVVCVLPYKLLNKRNEFMWSVHSLMSVEWQRMKHTAYRAQNVTALWTMNVYTVFCYAYITPYLMVVFARKRCFVCETERKRVIFNILSGQPDQNW